MTEVREQIQSDYDQAVSTLNTLVDNLLETYNEIEGVKQDSVKITFPTKLAEEWDISGIGVSEQSIFVQRPDTENEAMRARLIWIGDDSQEVTVLDTAVPRLDEEKGIKAEIAAIEDKIEQHIDLGHDQGFTHKDELREHFKNLAEQKANVLDRYHLACSLDNHSLAKSILAELDPKPGEDIFADADLPAEHVQWHDGLIDLLRKKGELEYRKHNITQKYADMAMRQSLSIQSRRPVGQAEVWELIGATDKLAAS